MVTTIIITIARSMQKLPTINPASMELLAHLVAGPRLYGRLGYRLPGHGAEAPALGAERHAARLDLGCPALTCMRDVCVCVDVHEDFITHETLYTHDR